MEEETEIVPRCIATAIITAIDGLAQRMHDLRPVAAELGGIRFSLTPLVKCTIRASTAYRNNVHQK